MYAFVNKYCSIYHILNFILCLTNTNGTIMDYGQYIVTIAKIGYQIEYVLNTASLNCAKTLKI